MRNVLIFVIALLGPLVVIRVAIHLLMKRAHDITVAIQGVRFHHLHLGVLLIFAASLLFLFTGINIFSLGFLGIGLGLVLDEFIPSVLIPHQEPLSTKIYLSSLRGTIILFIAVVIVVLAFFLAFKYL